MAHQHHDSHAADHGAHAHPGPKTYFQIAVVLGIITVLEVAIVYIPALHGIVVPSLLLLSAVKFALVALFYMHLKYDPRLYSNLISAGLTIAAAVIVSLMALQFNNGFLP